MISYLLNNGLRKLYLLLFLSGTHCLLCYSQSTGSDANPLQSGTFPYRGWSIAVDAEQLDVEELYFNTAVAKAKEYNINTLELHDFVMKGGIVDALIKYDSLLKVKKSNSFLYNGKKLSKGDKDIYAARFASMLRKAKDKNISVNVWYHVLRDLPQEIVTEYPEISNIESGFVWNFLKNSLSEFFQKFPDVDRLTLVSLHETPSILKNTGRFTREEVLLKLYMTIYETCKIHGKALIIRDFIVSQNDFETFWTILDKLPQDIYIMTKSVLADWSHVDLANNPVMHRYKNRNFIVEFDLYGEWSGRGDFPVCYPEDIIRHLREAKSFKATGAMGRLIHDDRPASMLPFKTIFDSPLDINVYTFSKYLSEPIPWLGETKSKWDEDIEAIDKKYWIHWAKRKYGEAAAVAVVRALERTTEINKLTFNIAGRSFRYYVWYPTFFKYHPANSNTIADTWNTFSLQANEVGLAYLKDEKTRALKLVKASLSDVKALKGILAADDQILLETLFESMLSIVKSYELALNGYAAVYTSVHTGIANTKNRTAAANDLNLFAKKLDLKKGKGWYFELSNSMRILAKEVLEGKVPAK